MTQDETVELLTLVKGNWFRQPTDDLTIAMWKQLLGEWIKLPDAWQAVIDLARSGMTEPPTAGQVHQAASEYARSRIADEEQQARRIRLEKWRAEHPDWDKANAQAIEDMRFARANPEALAAFKEMLAKLDERLKPRTRAKPLPTRLNWPPKKEASGDE